MTYTTALSAAIRSILGRRSYSMADAGRAMGVDPVQVRRWNANGWTRQAVDKLCAAMDITPEESGRELR